MTPSDLLRFAVTAIARHRVRSSLSLLGVAIGVAAVVILTGLGEGARQYVVSQFANIGSNLVVIMPGKNETTGFFPGFGGVPNDLTLDDARALRRELKRVQRVAPFSAGNDTVAHRERRRRVMIAGTTPEFLTIRRLKVGRGQFLPEGEMDRGASVVVMGAKVAEELFPSESPLGKVVRIGDWRMRVIGVMERKGNQVGLDLDDIVFVPVATGMRIFNQSSLFRIFIEGSSHTELTTICDAAVGVLKERHDEEDVTCFSPASVVDALSDILSALTFALAGIAAISLSVAGLGIMNLMLVSVSERTSEVGLLKAVGAANRQVMAVFLSEAILVSSAGGALGLGLGWIGLRVLTAIYPAFPAAPPVWAVVAAIAVSAGVGVLFGVIPARRAARLDPVVALAGR